MTSSLLTRVSLSIIALLCFALICWRAIENHPISELPFRLELVPEHTYVLRARGDVPLPPALMEGQIVELEQMSVIDRAAMFYPATVWPGARVTLVLKDHARIVRQSVLAELAPPTTLARFQAWIRGTASASFLLIVALLTLWGGRDWTAWGLAFFSLGQLINDGLYEVVSPPIINFWIQQVRQAAQILSNGLALYMTSESLVPPWVPRLSRRKTRLAIAFLATLAIIATIVPEVSLTYCGSRLPGLMYTVRDTFTTTVMVLPASVLVIGHSRASHARKLRIRWMLFSTLSFLVVTVALTFMSEVAHPYLYQMTNTVAFALTILGYLYAILRARVVDVAFLVDRTLAFSATTAILFGCFSLLEQALDRLVVAEKLSSTAKALGAFLVALALRPLHRWSDRSLEGLFFHRQRAVVSELRSFSMKSPFFESQEALLSEACRHILLPCAAGAIYERDSGAYRSRVASGQGWPRCVDADDPMFVALRAKRRDLDIKDMKSAVGGNVLAFPMMLGNTLTGAVICRPRSGEQLDSNVRAALSEVTRCLATSLHLLRYEEQAGLIADIAAGCTDPLAARSRAIELLRNAGTVPGAERPMIQRE